MKTERATPLVIVLMALCAADWAANAHDLDRDIRMWILAAGVAASLMLVGSLLWDRIAGGFHGFFHGVATFRDGKCERKGCVICANPKLRREGNLALHGYMTIVRREPCRIVDCEGCENERSAREQSAEDGFLRAVLDDELGPPVDWPAAADDQVGTCASCRHFSFRDAVEYFDSFPAMVAMREESGRLWTGRSMAESPRFEDLGACRIKGEIHPHTETCERYALGAPQPAPERPSPPRTLRVIQPEDMRSLEPLDSEPLQPEITREAPALDSDSEAP